MHFDVKHAETADALCKNSWGGSHGAEISAVHADSTGGVMPRRSRFTILTLAFAVFAATACSDPYSYEIPADMQLWKSDEVLRKNIEKLPPSDKEVLARYMVAAGLRQTFGGGSSKLTIRQALEEQRSVEAKQAAKEAEEKALAERVKREREAALAQMSAVVTVAMTGLAYHDADWRNGINDGFAVAFAFQNTTDRDIAAVKGTVRFADMFDEEIKRVSLSMDSGIPAGKVVTWQGRLDYNHFIASDQKLRNTAPDKLKVSWTPETYLFGDGTRMEAPL